MERSGQIPARRVDTARDESGRGRAVRAGRLHPADRLRERRQPDARPRIRPPLRDGDEGRARRDAGAPRSAVHRRGHGAGIARRRAGRLHGDVGRRVDQVAHPRPDAVLGAVPVRRDGPGVLPAGGDGDGRRHQRAARAPRLAARSHPDDEGDRRRHRRRRRDAAPAAGRRAVRPVGHSPGRRAAAGPELPDHRRRGRRLRDGRHRDDESIARRRRLRRPPPAPGIPRPGDRAARRRPHRRVGGRRVGSSGEPRGLRPDRHLRGRR